MNELSTAETADDVVDALIDLCVVAIGTLDLFDVDARLAWDRVHEANMNKQVGIKESRPNPLGLPDLVKPEGWTAPSHKDNVGLLGLLFDE
jgi:predicted HAD superfamily Cof-like phosphohydrolase